MLSFAYMRLIRNQFPEAFWEHRTAYWAAPFGYNHIYYWLFVRCFGAALISFQRYVTVCQNTTKLNQVGLCLCLCFILFLLRPFSDHAQAQFLADLPSPLGPSHPLQSPNHHQHQHNLRQHNNLQHYHPAF